MNKHTMDCETQSNSFAAGQAVLPFRELEGAGSAAKELPRIIMRCKALILMMLLGFSLFSQKVLLQGWYWDYPASIGIQRYAENYVNYIPDFVDAGFDYIWLPPLSRASQGIASVGYDIMDYYDLGGYGLGPTRFGTRKDVDRLIDSLHANGIQVIADMIYNQRVGGQWEDNPAVTNYITGMNLAKIDSGYQPYPSDRSRCYILLGGNSGNGPGTYYIKFRSASMSSNYFTFPYTVDMWTGKTPFSTDSLLYSDEVEPNNGGECSDTDNFYNLGTSKFAHIDAYGCGIDEFRLTLDTTMYKATGDTLYISMENTDPSGLGSFSDHYVYGLWSGPLNEDISSQVIYQTATDFTHMPSGRGYMTWRNFKPDGNPTMLAGDWDEMLFFYDIDQYVPNTISTITDWQEWMYDSIHIDGMRLDAVKNYTYDFTAQNLDSLHAMGHNPEMVVGEFYDFNPYNLTGWINTVKSLMSPGAADSIQPELFDFALRGALQAACDQYGYDVRNVFTSGIVDGAGGSGANSVTWVNNHDFRDPGQPVSVNPELAYAYILTNPKIGTPDVYLLDYQSSNFLRGRIKGLMHADKKYCAGSDEVDYLTAANSPYSSTYYTGLNTTTLIYQMRNPRTNRAVIAAINFAGEDLDVMQQINTAYVGIGDTFTDIFGINHNIIRTVTPQGQLQVTLPARSFTLWVQGGDLVDSLISLGDTIAPTPPTAIKKVVNNHISVFPNPFNNNVNIRLGAPVDGAMNIEIFDMSGRQLFAQDIQNPDGMLTISPQLASAGMYLMKVSTGSGTQYFKLAKE